MIWLLFVLIIPQIGDTMDPDNQVPGGLFAALGIPKAQEHAVLAHFSAYDTLRNGLEMTSVTKHFERLSFALLGIKSTYQPISFLYLARHARLWIGSIDSDRCRGRNRRWQPLLVTPF